MLPLISSFTDASSGPQGSLSNATADMIWPDVQYPHWYPSHAKNAACRGCKLSGVPRPSMVVISSPSCITASVRHEFTRLPFTCTVHAPHCPWSQPFLVPVNWSRSRSISNSDARTSTVIACGVLFTVKLMVLSVTCIVFLLKMASHSYCSILELTFCPIPLVALGLLPYPAGHGHTGEFKVCCRITTVRLDFVHQISPGCHRGGKTHNSRSTQVYSNLFCFATNRAASAFNPSSKIPWNN